MARQNTRTGDRMFAGTRDRMAIRSSTPLRHPMITGRKRRAADRDCAVPHMHHVRGETPNEPHHQPARRHRPLRGLARLTIAPPGAVAPRPTGAAAPSCARHQPWRPGPTKAGSAAKSDATPTASASAPRVRRTRVKGWSGNSASDRSWSTAWSTVAAPLRGVRPELPISLLQGRVGCPGGGAPHSDRPAGAIPRGCRARRSGRRPGRRSGPRRARWRGGARS
ncbi:hypothetical protein SAMN02745898_110177 [Streptomyces sp. 136MFCol5.1]|nr:hypothetical protein SAMN02745898_110177 [Streptomyces sp. 136MFCol5.1]SFT25062.1 hypothetical protein SAMN04487982_111176 [Streptomyces sp. ok210]